MKNKHASHENDRQAVYIPELDIIDLESESNLEDAGYDVMPAPNQENLPTEGGRGRKRSLLSRVNLHVIFLIVIVLFVAGIIYKVMTFGVHVDLSEIFKDGPGDYEDTFDTILPLIDADNNPVFTSYEDGATILAFGNAPFADDRDSEDSLINMMQKQTGANIYNCSVSGSYLATELPDLNASECPWDIFNFYWLCTIAVGNNPLIDEEYKKGLEILGDTAPPEARQVYDTLKSVDMDSVDVLVVMYDGSDYLAGHKMYNDSDATDLTQFTGNLEAGIELLQFYYPNIRLIVLSPTYAYGLDEEGNYVSSDIQRYGQDVLSTYVIKQYASCASRSVTFVDNLYGTINEDNAKKYLTDHLHLNIEGRKKVAERFAYALNYFRDSQKAPE